MNARRAALVVSLAVGVVFGAGACRDFRAAFTRCVDGGTCVDPDAGGGSDSDASTDAGEDAGYVPHSRQRGQSCELSDDCAVGDFCVDGVCCDVGACGRCEVCNAPGQEGTCTYAAAGTDPHGECTADSSSCQQDTCNGAGSCDAPDGTSCGAASCELDELTLKKCSGGTCTNDVHPCPTTCEASGTACEGTCDPVDGGGCDAGQYCDPESWGCVDYLSLGTPCDQGMGQCAPGLFCVDGVCCAQASCAGPCKACNVPGSAGGCANIPLGQLPKEFESCEGDCATGACNGLGECGRLVNGESCGAGSSYCDAGAVANDQCNAAGQCVAVSSPCDAGQSCFDTGSGAYCTWTGGQPGDPCSFPNDCMSLSCVGGVCCGQFCGACEQCDPSSGYSSCVYDAGIAGCSLDGGSDGGPPDAGSNAGTDAGGGADAGFPNGDAGGLPPCPDGGFDGGPFPGCAGEL